MKFFRIVFLISIGGLWQANVDGSGSTEIWMTALAISGAGWGWAAAGQAIQAGYRRVLYALAGKPLPMPETDPKALAAEIKTLNAQLSQLRDTATSFDVSFDQTLERLNDRLSRLEQQSAYVQAGRRG